METKRKMPKVMRVLTSVLCIIFALVLISNLVVIVKGTLNPEKPPSIFGYTSMIVMSGSMSGDAPDHIEVGDMIVTKPPKVDELAVGDIITYMENGETTVTHRIVEIYEDGTFQTKGDANDSLDTVPIKKEEVIGTYWFRIPKLGDVAMFAQTPVGMLIFIGVPLVLYILLDFILRGKENKKDKKKTDAAMAEKEKLERELAELKEKMATGNAESAETAEAECSNAEMQNAECSNTGDEG